MVEWLAQEFDGIARKSLDSPPQETVRELAALCRDMAAWAKEVDDRLARLEARDDVHS